MLTLLTLLTLTDTVGPHIVLNMRESKLVPKELLCGCKAIATADSHSSLANQAAFYLEFHISYESEAVDSGNNIFGSHVDDRLV